MTDQRAKQVYKYEIKLNARQNGIIMTTLAELDELGMARLSAQELVDLCFDNGHQYVLQQIGAVKAQLKAQQQEAEKANQEEASTDGTESAPTDAAGDTEGGALPEDGNAGALADSPSGIIIP